MSQYRDTGFLRPLLLNSHLKEILEMDFDSSNESNDGLEGLPRAVWEVLAVNAPAKSFGASYNKNHDRDFVFASVEVASANLERFRGGGVELIGFSPIWQTNGHQGVLALEFRSPDGSRDTYTLLCAFGRPETVRSQLDRRRDYQVDANRVFNETLYLATWDEAWAFACRLAESMQVAGMTMRFGI